MAGDDVKELIDLSWQLQLALGSGYLAYLISYAGVRDHHTAADAVFRAIAFGLIANILLAWDPFSQPGNIACAFLATIFAGALWRWRIGRWARYVLRWSNISWADDIPTAWLSITALSTDARPTQIAVELLDGRILLCEDTRPFADAPHGPYTLGLDGSAAIYVTAEMRPNGEWIEKQDARHETEGDLITYIPAPQIKRVDFRLWTKLNGSVEQAEVIG